VASSGPAWFTVTKWVVLLGLVGVAAYVGLGWYTAHAYAASFTDQALSDLEAKLLRISPLPPGDDLPPRTGKVLVIVPSTWRRVGEHNRLYRSCISPESCGQMERIEPPQLFDGMLALPPEIRAGSPTEAATIVFCEPLGAVAGQYVSTNGGGSTTAMVQEATLRAYDRSGRPLGACVLEGGRLKMVIHSASEAMTPAPDVVTVVKRMPLVDPAKLPPLEADAK
jgi:hypothetical protein